MPQASRVRGDEVETSAGAMNRLSSDAGDQGAERHLGAALAEAEAIGAAPRAESTRALLHRAREEIGR
jgi:hypothetical protein